MVSGFKIPDTFVFIGNILFAKYIFKKNEQKDSFVVSVAFCLCSG